MRSHRGRARPRTRARRRSSRRARPGSAAAGRGGPRSGPSSGLTAVSSRPATRNTAPIANGPKPPSSSRSGTSTTSSPKRRAGSVFSQRPPRKRRSCERAAERAGNLRFRGRRRTRAAPSRERDRDHADDAERGADAAASAMAPNIGPRIAPKTAAPKAVPISSPRRSRGVRPSARRARRPRSPCSRSPGRTGRGRAPTARSAEAKPKLASASRTEAEHDRALRAVPRGREPAGNPAEERPGAERADEQPDAGLGEPELVRVPGHERRQDAEQHRVDEDDDADEDQQRLTCVTARRYRPRATKNSASRVRFRPPPQRTFGFRLRPTGVDSTYSRPVLAARGNLGAGGRSVKGVGTGKLDVFLICGTFAIAPFATPGITCQSAAPSSGASIAPQKFSEPVAVSSAPPTDVSACAYSPSGGAST